MNARRLQYFLLSLAMLGVSGTAVAIPISDMGQQEISVYIDDTHSSDAPVRVGHGFVRYDRAYVDQEVAAHSDEWGFEVSFPILDAMFEMFGVTFGRTEIEWTEYFDYGASSALHVGILTAAGAQLLFGAGSEDYVFYFDFAHGYPGSDYGYPCYVMTPDGPWSCYVMTPDGPWSEEDSLSCEFDATEVPVSVGEPAPFGLLAAGLLGLALSRRRNALPTRH